MPATLLSRAPLFDSLTAALSFSLPSTVTPLSQLSHQPGLVDKLAGWFLTWAAWICAISRYIFILVAPPIAVLRNSIADMSPLKRKRRFR